MRIIAIGAFALLCTGGAFQDEQAIRDQIARMGDEAPPARDDAESKIVAIGPPALPLLEEAVKSADDPEIVSRAKRAIEKIEYQEKVNAAVGPVLRVTIDAAKMPLGKVIAEIEKQTGETIVVDDALKTLPVTMAFKDEPYLKVLHRIAAGTPGVALDFSGGKASLRSGPFDGRTAFCADRIALQVKSVRRARDIVGGGLSDPIVSFALANPGDNAPSGYEIHLNEFTRCTERGDDPWGDENENIFYEPETWFLKEGNLAADDIEITLKGKLTLYYIVEQKTVELAMPSEAGDESSVALSDNDKVRVVQNTGLYRVDYSYVLPEDDVVIPIYNLRRRALDDLSNIKAFDSEGEGITIGSNRGGSSSDDKEYSKHTNIRWDGATPAKIRVTLPAKIHTEEIPFEITVPLK